MMIDGIPNRPLYFYQKDITEVHHCAAACGCQQEQGAGVTGIPCRKTRVCISFPAGFLSSGKSNQRCG